MVHKEGMFLAVPTAYTQRHLNMDAPIMRYWTANVYFIHTNNTTQYINWWDLKENS